MNPLPAFVQMGFGESPWLTRCLILALLVGDVLPQVVGERKIPRLRYAIKRAATRNQLFAGDRKKQISRYARNDKRKWGVLAIRAATYFVRWP